MPRIKKPVAGLQDDLDLAATPLDSVKSLSGGSVEDDTTNYRAEVEEEPEPETTGRPRPQDLAEFSPLSPPEGQCEPVTSDGGVLKMVIESGTGDKPPRHARCLVHYVGRLAVRGDLLMDTKAETREPVRVVAGRDSCASEVGLNLAVAAMTRGEKAAVYIMDPKYGWGEKGNFSFPAVPPNAKVVYEVELIDWEEEEDDNGDSTSGLLFEERLERAEKRRREGNELFTAGELKKALGKYALALSYIDEDFLMQLEGHYLDSAHRVKAPIHLNMAACQLKLGDNHTAIYNCNQVLELEPGHAKALYRRGRARHLLGQTESALEDLTQAAVQEPDDPAIKGELAAVRKSLKEERKAQARMFRGTFHNDVPAPKAKEQEAKKKREADAREALTSEERHSAYTAALEATATRHSSSGLLGLLWGLLAWLLAALGLRRGSSSTTTTTTTAAAAAGAAAAPTEPGPAAAEAGAKAPAAPAEVEPAEAAAATEAAGAASAAAADGAAEAAAAAAAAPS